MVDRDNAAAALFVVSVITLFLNYGIAGGDWIDLELLEPQTAFYIFVAAWVGMYTYSGGKDWQTATSFEKLITGVSWGVLLLYALESGFIPEIAADTDYITGFLSDFEYVEFGLIALHTASAYLVWRAD